MGPRSTELGDLDILQEDPRYNSTRVLYQIQMCAKCYHRDNLGLGPKKDPFSTYNMHDMTRKAWEAWKAWE